VKIIASINDNNIYRGFLKPFLNYYDHLGVSVYVAYVGLNPPEGMDQDRFLHIDPVPGYDLGIQAKLARSYYATRLDDNELLTFSDIDMFILDLQWYRNSIAKFVPYLKSGLLDLLVFGANGYKTFNGYRPDVDGKWTIPYMTATPLGIRNALGIDFYDTFESFLRSYQLIRKPIDGKESTLNDFENFSDESLYRWAVMSTFSRVAHVDFPDFHFQRPGRRIDRICDNFELYGHDEFDSNFWEQNKCTQNQKQKMANGEFLDLWPQRPYEKHRELIDDILSFYTKNNNFGKA
jgi:hypothetical protein